MAVERLTYTVQEAAAVIGVSVPKLYQMCNAKEFPHVRLGARIVIPIERLHKWLNQDDDENSS